jgi:membrane-associated phospholipid phosphatase
MNRLLTLLLSGIFSVFAVFGQAKDTIEQTTSLRKSDKVSYKVDKARIFNAPYAKFIIPAALISYGVIARGNKPLNALDKSTHNEISEHLTVPIPIDDYSQLAPAVAVYGLNLAGIKGKNNIRDLAFVMATSYFIMGTTVYAIKNTTNIRRPDGSNKRSFPSGHTATAFVGAHILCKEYKETSVWICVAGYTVATGTGVLRVLNKKHWISDVVTGAGIGILSAEVGYILLPKIRNALRITDKNLSVSPVVRENQYGIEFAYAF